MLRAVRLLAAARMLSLVGSEVTFVGRMLEVFDRTGSTIWLAAALLAFFGGLAIFGPLGGSLGDRFDRRLVMIVSLLASAVVFGATGLVRDPLAIVVLTLAGAAAFAPFISACQAAVPNLAAEGELAWANGLVLAGQNAGMLLGPALGGLLYSIVGGAATLGLGAVALVAAAALVASIQGSFSGGARRAGRSTRAGRAGRGVAPGPWPR